MQPIDQKTAQEMAKNYIATKKKLIDETYGINDTESVWMPVDELKAFVEQLPDDASGVRVYLGSYNGTQQPYPNQTTVIFAGTLLLASGKNDDCITGSVDPTLKGGGLGPWNKSQVCPPECI